ncbi:MAG: radical SAM protein [Spirochaetaceae bacterium]|jgi:nitrogen fixation protein NifB|nr:radical SAM protein [Spirochaetaceae bacterium]
MEQSLLSQHPCFNGEQRHKTGRIHLPVAEKCNVQCNFCNRRYDCANESRPGVTSALLNPSQAADYLDLALEKMDSISVVGIAGPGDPFANPDETFAVLDLVRERHPEKILCLATNGLDLPDHADRLKSRAISHVTVTVNAVDPAVGAAIYGWVRKGPRIYRGAAGAELLFRCQHEGIELLKDLGITVKVNTVVIPGVNDSHVRDVAAWAGEIGVDVQNCVALVPVEGTPFGALKAPEPGLMAGIRLEAGRFLPQMTHCARCRADAVGLLSGENAGLAAELMARVKAIKPREKRPYVAAVSWEGLLVNRHLGEAERFLIYGMESGGLRLVEERPAPARGGGDLRWERAAEILGDCFAVLAANCGPAPRRILERRGINVVTAEGLIEDLAGPLLEGKPLPRIYGMTPDSCGMGGCKGEGAGCA